MFLLHTYLVCLFDFYIAVVWIYKCYLTVLILVKTSLITFLSRAVDTSLKIKFLLTAFATICPPSFPNNHLNIVIFHIRCDKLVKPNSKYMLKYFKVVGNLLLLNANNFCGILYYIHNSTVISLVGPFTMIKFLSRDNIKLLL